MVCGVAAQCTKIPYNIKEKAQITPYTAKRSRLEWEMVIHGKTFMVYSTLVDLYYIYCQFDKDLIRRKRYASR